MRTLISSSLALPALIFGLSHSLAAYAGTELINNGNFGNINSPSANGWTSISSTLTLKPQITTYGCGQFACYGGTKDVWACSSSTSSLASFSQENGIATLKPKTRYRVSFNAFRNISAGATDTGIPAAIVARVKSGISAAAGEADYIIKDILLAPMYFGGFTPGINSATAFEFVTPADTNPSNQPNLATTKLSFSFDGTKSNNSGSICLSHISLQEVEQFPTTTKVTVNTLGYPMQGKKVATLSVPSTTVGATSVDLSGYSWRVLYKGSSSPVYSYSVSVNHFAVKTDEQGQPLKGTNSKYLLDTNPDGSYKVVGGTGTGGQGNYFPPNNGILPTGALAKQDADTGEYTYTLDFSDLGIPRSEPVAIPDGSRTPSLYTDTEGKSWYILSGNSYSSSSTNESYEYKIVVKDKGGNIVATSSNFSILNAPFNGLKKDALNSLYHQRSGEAITPNYGRGAKAENAALNHDAGHATENASCFTGKDLHGNDWGDGGTGCATAATGDYSGGWYDAADHGKYVVNGGVALWTLQNMIERLQKKGTLNTAFPAGTLGLPATYDVDGKKLDNLSELMAEARKEMAWMKKMQIPSGLSMKVPVGNQALKQVVDTNGRYGKDSTNSGVYQVKLESVTETRKEYTIVTVGGKTYKTPMSEYTLTRKKELPAAPNADGAIDYAGGKLPRLRIKLNLTNENVGGMVFHALHDAGWTGIPLDPSKDPKARKLMYPTTAATLNFAAVAAQCSRIWKGIDDKFANDCLTAAQTAWNAAASFAGRGNILRYEYTNTSGAAGTATDGMDDPNWTSVDRATKANKSILQYGFALNPMFDGGGAYGDLRVSDEFLWASKELSLANPQGSYMPPSIPNAAPGVTDTCTSGLQCFNWISGFDWQNVSPLGYLSSWTNNPTSSNADLNTLISGANTYASYAQGYSFSKTPYKATDRNSHYDWGANGSLLNRSLILLAGYEANLAKVSLATRAYCKAFATTGYQNAAWATFSTEKDACTSAYKDLDTAVNSMGYLLGRNAVNKSFISGYGANSMTQPHHRWFSKAADVRYPNIPAGFVAGGPNTRDLPALRANTTRYSYEDMTKWLDDQSGVVTEASNTAWQTGDINDSAHEYLETKIIPKCTTGLGNADRRWSIPAANSSGAVSYTPQKCYDDDYRSFATNEIAINWQAPLVWVSQTLSEIYQ